jgi:hypothetical protein
MGADGAGVFDDDTACDVRDEYRELLEEQIDDQEAVRRVVTSFSGRLDDEERPLLWLALAAAQCEWGRLDPQVRDQALAVIDAEAGMDRWLEAGPLAAGERRAVLRELRLRLTGPQPRRKTFRRRWR